MIYVTGDTHGEIVRFEKSYIKKIKNNDTLIICGDFGFIWNGSEHEQRILSLLSKLKFNILFLDGKHENFELLKKYKLVDIFGSQAQQIRKNIYHLLRGHIYEIEGKTIFTFGGGESPDKEIRINTGTWWKDEMPTINEMKHAVNELREYGEKIDYVLTHEPSGYIKKIINRNSYKINSLETFLNSLSKSIEYKKWFFGCMHIDKKISEKHYAVFKEIIPIDIEPNSKWNFLKNR